MILKCAELQDMNPWMELQLQVGHLIPEAKVRVPVY
jgi:hypothetical protein